MNPLRQILLLLCVIALCASAATARPRPIAREKIREHIEKRQDNREDDSALNTARKLARDDGKNDQRLKQTLASETPHAEGQLPWGFQRIYALYNVKATKLPAIVKRYTSYTKRRDLARDNYQSRRTTLVQARTTHLNSNKGKEALAVANVIVKFDTAYWASYERDYQNLLKGLDNCLDSKLKTHWPAISLLAEAMSKFSTTEDRQALSDDILKATLQTCCAPAELKAITAAKTYDDRLKKRSELYSALCKRYRLGTQPRKQDSSKSGRGERKGPRPLDKPEKIKLPKTKPVGGF